MLVVSFDVSNSDTLFSVVNLGSETTTVYAKTTLGTCESYEECYDGPRIARVTEQELSQSLPEHLIELFERSAGHLNESEKADFGRLLCKYSSVFSSSSEDIGRTNLVQHTINTGHAAPIRQPPRRLPLGKRAIEKEEITNMLDRGIIEPSNSAWASPVVLVTKKILH